MLDNLVKLRQREREVVTARWIAQGHTCASSPGDHSQPLLLGRTQNLADLFQRLWRENLFRIEAINPVVFTFSEICYHGELASAVPSNTAAISSP